MKKVLQWLAVAVFAVLVCVPALAQAQTVPTTITSFRVTDKNKQDLTSAFTNQDIYLTVSWRAQGEVHEGDTFSLAIPDILDFPATNAASFNIYAPDGAVMATAQVMPGRVAITYTAWVNGKENVQGTLWLAAHVKADAAAGTTTLRLIDEATGQVVETSFETKHYGIIQHEVIAKWGVKTDHGTVEWSVRLNHAADILTNVVLEDTAQDGTRIIPGSFRLYRVHMDAYSNIDPASWVRVNVPEPTINGNTFTWDLSSVDFQGNQYFMYYETEGTETASNTIQLKSRETTQSSRYQYVNQDSGGNGNGDNRPQQTEPETPPTPEPNPGPQPQPTPEESEPEPQPKQEPSKPVKKAKKKAALPATGDTQNVAVVAGIGVIAIIVAMVASMPLRRD
ncbi:Ig-like domain-containing protein [Lancefieldella parvula]|uniref:Ig-like domain-containing protein n=1 Tax=Lancefieldella parvula TaxID=1382 RepID=UPI0028D6E3C4|nr:Ig-like domain-containing protein [Lancefieldella parvula]